jgi:hypothetical protein
VALLRDALTKIDLSEVKYSHFAQMLYMGVIVKNRKSYRYKIDDESHILYTMQNITDQYVDYDVFQAYLNLDEGVSAYLQKRAQDDENRCSDEQFIAIVKVIDGYIKNFKEKLEQLDNGYADERDGALKKVFYRAMLEVFIQDKIVLS